MLLYKRSHTARPGWSLLADLKKQYRNDAILKPLHFEPLVAAPVLRLQHRGPTRKPFRKLEFPEDKVVKEAYRQAKRFNPSYSYPTLEYFADVQTEIMKQQGVDREEAYELAQWELVEANRMSRIEEQYSLGAAERYFGLRPQPFMTSTPDMEEERVIREAYIKVWKVAQLAIAGADNTTVETELDQLDLSEGTAAKLLRWFSDVRDFFEDDVVHQAMEPDPALLRDIVSISRDADNQADNLGYPLEEDDELDPEQAEVEQEMMATSKQAVAREEEQKRRAKGMGGRGGDQRGGKGGRGGRGGGGGKGNVAAKRGGKR